MYKTPELIKKIQLKDVQIFNQDRILAETGSKLDLQQAFDIIKEVSLNFQQYDERAIEADQLLSTLIERELEKSKKEKREAEKKEEERSEGKTEDGEIFLKRKAAAARKRKLVLFKIKLGLSKEKK